MKIYKYLITFLVAHISHASGFCVTHGQCQSISDETTACFLVKVDDSNTQKCETRCFTVYAGSYCDFIPDKRYGTCKNEDYKQVDKNLDCRNAIPAEIIKDL